MIKHSLLVVTLLVGTASAQPGATAPSGPAPATSEPAPPPNVTGDADIDAAIAKAAAAAPSIENVVKDTVRRARRAVSIGPTVGLWSAAFIDPGDVDAALSFGVGIETFDVPVMPSIDALQGMIAERAKAEAKDRIKAASQGRAVDPVAVDQIAAQAYEEARKQVLALDNVRAKAMEPPGFTIGLEANRLFGADRWLGRARVGVGIWKLTLAASVAVGRACRGDGCDSGVKLFTGPEVVVHVLTSKGPRASVVDGFVRFDYQATGRADTTYDQIVLGARFLLDLI